MSADERTGWRDEELSREHRRWGFNLPAVDIDFLMTEYDAGEPVLIADYKHRVNLRLLTNPRTGQAEQFDASNYRSLRRLADRAKLQCWVVLYDKHPWRFRVFPLNDHARRWWNGATDVEMNHQRYLQCLYRVRHREEPAWDAFWRDYGRTKGGYALIDHP